MQSSEVEDETVAEADDKDKDESVETDGSAASGERETTLPTSSNDTTVAMCEQQEQLCVQSSPGQIAESATTSGGEMCLPIEALVQRGQKSNREDQNVRYPSISGTVSERCVQSVEHILQVLCCVLFSCCLNYFMFISCDYCLTYVNDE